MPSATTKLGLLSTVSAIVWLVLPGTANADTQTNVTFDAVVPGEELDGRLYLPEPMPVDPPAILMMHGCTGMWSDSNPATGVAQRHIEKCGHGFDHVGTTAFPTTKYNATELADATKKAECAMRDADIDSLAFILDEI